MSVPTPHAREPRPIPARAGIGLRAAHHRQVLQQRPEVAWFEVHSENFFAAGGAARRYLREVAQVYPLSLHGVGLSLGSTDPLDLEHLRRLKNLAQQVSPALISEHLSWGSVGGRHMNDLLPLPYTEEALRHLVSRVKAVQEYLGRQILIENVSSYLQFRSSALSEWEFLAAVAFEAGCGILLDVNNVFVSARNHGFEPLQYLQGLPRRAVGELHLAGHSVRQIGEKEILIDTHNARVCREVWDLYRAAIERFGPTPTLIEWDADIPPLEVLLDEARHADLLLGESLAVAA